MPLLRQGCTSGLRILRRGGGEGPRNLSRAGRRHCCVRISAVKAIVDFAASAASDRDAVLARCKALAKDLDTVPEIASALQIPVNPRKLAAAPRASGVLRCSTQARLGGPMKDDLVEKLLQHDADEPRERAHALRAKYPTSLLRAPVQAFAE